MKTLLLFITVLLPVFLITGCGSNYTGVDLTGKITVDGTPIENGFVSFTPSEGNRGTGVRVPISNGNYAAKHVPVGKTRVSFTAVKKTGKKTKGLGGEDVDEQVSIIPGKYKEGMETEIIVNQQTLDFELTTK
ncbi:MAG: YgdI/YgdR family lipoprotein [Planctomycetaceae bacterium]|jgi:hypothetical protein|nr:YgdI/YgdR family lipoprotein [Planctomycetaceae bacterium]